MRKPLDNSLLAYSFATYPIPLQVSTEHTPSTGRINVTITNPRKAFANQILVAVPVGSGPGAVFAEQPKAAVSTGKWVPSSLKAVPENAQDLMEGGSYARFVFDCPNPADFDISYDLALSFVGGVTQTPAQFTVYIYELSGATPDRHEFTLKGSSAQLSSEAPRFYLENLVAVDPSTIPVTEFGNGSPILFRWQSNGTFFQIYERSNQTPIYSGSQTSFTLEAGVTHDTTFFLAASTSGATPGGQSPGFEPIFLYDTITITVLRPDLTPNTIAAAGSVTLNGPFVTNGSSDMKGPVSITNLTAGSSLTSLGMTNLATTRVSEALTVVGNTELADATINGRLEAQAGADFPGGINATAGPARLLGPSEVIGDPILPVYKADTDGLVIGMVTPSPFQDRLNIGLARITATSDGFMATAMGGIVGGFDKKGRTIRTPSTNTFTLPVRKGAEVAINVLQDSADAPVITEFRWIPFGHGSLDYSPAIPNLSERQAIGPATSLPPAGVPSDEALQKLAGVLEEIVGKPIAPELRDRLIDALREL
jgi:hypothetical protein